MTEDTGCPDGRVTSAAAAGAGGGVILPANIITALNEAIAATATHFAHHSTKRTRDHDADIDKPSVEAGAGRHSTGGATEANVDAVTT